MRSSTRFAVPFRVQLKTSFILNGALLLMYLGAGYWLWAFELTILFKLVMLAALVVGCIGHVRHYLLHRGRRSVVSLVWRDEASWQLETARGERVEARLLGSSYVTPWLIVLNFRPQAGGRAWPVVILPDSVDSTTFRRLGMKLRLHGGQGQGRSARASADRIPG